MIDIETLSRKPDGCIISIGMAVFNESKVLAVDSWAIEHRYWHGHLEPNTLHWWFQQSEEARHFSFSGTHTDSHVAVKIKDLFAEYMVHEVWANDPDFDLVMLKGWWSRCSALEYPVKFWNHRSYRTLLALVRDLTGTDPKKDFAGEFIAHNPADDATAQARVVIACRQLLRNNFQLNSSPL